LNDSRVVEASSLEEARKIYSNLINEEQTYEEYSSNALVDVDIVDFIDESPVVSSQIRAQTCVICHYVRQDTLNTIS
jgi:hypothetical protein